MHRDWSALVGSDHSAAEGQGFSPCPCEGEVLEYDVFTDGAFCNGQNCPPVPDLSLSPEVVQRLAEVFGIIAGADEDMDGLKAEAVLKGLITSIGNDDYIPATWSKSQFTHHPEMVDFDGDTLVQGAVNPFAEEPFGPTVLAGKAAERFLRYMKEDCPNPLAQASLERGRKLIAEMEQNGSIKLK